MYTENLPESEFWEENEEFELKAVDCQHQYQGLMNKYQQIIMKESMVSAYTAHHNMPITNTHFPSTAHRSNLRAHDGGQNDDIRFTR